MYCIYVCFGLFLMFLIEIGIKWDFFEGYLSFRGVVVDRGYFEYFVWGFRGGYFYYDNFYNMLNIFINSILLYN